MEDAEREKVVAWIEEGAAPKTFMARGKYGPSFRATKEGKLVAPTAPERREEPPPVAREEPEPPERVPTPPEAPEAAREAKPPNKGQEKRIDAILDIQEQIGKLTRKNTIEGLWLRAANHAANLGLEVPQLPRFYNLEWYRENIGKLAMQIAQRW